MQHQGIFSITNDGETEVKRTEGVEVVDVNKQSKVFYIQSQLKLS